METTYASLSVNCKRVYMRLACWAVTKVGLAMQERKTKTTADLHRESTAEFIQFIDSCDVVVLCQEHFQTDCPTTDDITAIKSTLKRDYGSTTNSDKVWRKWNDLKHAYRNIYLPNFIKGSGQNDDDALELCIKHHWAYKKNKNIKTHNNKCDLNRKPHEKKKMATYLEAPENIAQPGEMYPEAIAYLDLAKDHPMFLRPQRNAIASGTNSPATDSTEDDENNTPGDPEDKTFRSRMTTKGVFKSRNIQRQEELKKKRKGAPSEIIDLTKEKQIKAAERHSIAAKTHAEGVKCQSQIAAIEQAMKMGISADVLRPFMMKTLHTLFDSNTSNEDDDDDSEEVQFVSTSVKRDNLKGKIIKSELTLPSSVSSGPVASSRHENTVGTTSVGKNEQRGQCCAEDECVCSDDELDGYDCLQCVNCDKPCHSFCVQPFDDNDPGSERYLCFKCVLNSPSAAADA